MQDSWRAAVAEIAAEARYRLRSRHSSSWDFAVVFVSGHEGVRVSDVAAAVDAALNTKGATVGVVVDACSGWMTSGLEGRALPNGGKGVCVITAQLPNAPSTGLKTAVPFFIGKQELIGVSQSIMRLQSMVRVRGAQESASPRGWRHYLGCGENQPKGVLLFIDPMASKYVSQSVLDGLDLAFPLATKFGCVCADLPPSMSCLAVHRGDQGFQACQGGVAGLLLPSDISLHTIVCPASMRIGPEMRLTCADGQVVKEINGESPAKALAAVGRDAGPLEQLLLGRNGFLLGLEAPQQLDVKQKQVWDGEESWGSSERAPAYAALAKRAGTSDWLVRSIEALPDGRLVIRREDLKKVPPRVGPQWLRCQLHVRDQRWAEKELKLMLQRYLGARMFAPGLAQPFGALVCTCSSYATGGDGPTEADVVGTELRQMFGDRFPVSGVAARGEVAPPGVTLGGLDQKRTTRQGHTVSFCLLSYQPKSAEEMEAY